MFFYVYCDPQKIMDTQTYLELLAQAPMAVIILYFIYRQSKREDDFQKEVFKTLKNKD